MRDYSLFASTFWTGETGKKLRKHPSAQRLAAYLLTSPHSNVIGLYWLPLVYASNETGMTVDEIEAALAVLGSAEIDFAHYDQETEFVFVKNMARVQLSLGDEPLDARDNRLKGARKAAEAARRSKLHSRFVEKWGWHLGISKPSSDPLTSPLQAPPEPPSKGQPTASEDQVQVQGKGEEKPSGDGAPADGHDARPKKRDERKATWTTVLRAEAKRLGLSCTPDVGSKVRDAAIRMAGEVADAEGRDFEACLRERIAGGIRDHLKTGKAPQWAIKDWLPPKRMVADNTNGAPRFGGEDTYFDRATGVWRNRADGSVYGYAEGHEGEEQAS
jgi:hypothetical protein